MGSAHPALWRSLSGIVPTNYLFPKDLINLLTYKGGIYSVPVNVHRSNVMWD
ncbi:hypothetical protein [Deinococcus fonticola]|uniref:hypothetical protein n=1 Tax=Deinococcus fonticola TaxID=2528713 RepID=UPI00142F9A2C|nr:hypothetical protein [Deinococcus fonticola]